MNKTLINKTIAKYCGWKYCNDHWRNKSKNLITFELPNYAEDLNAMHEAETHLSDYQKVIYSEELTPKYNSVEDTAEIFASANRRAEAFLKTIIKSKR